MKPTLILLQDNLALRFKEGKLDQVAEIDYTTSIGRIKQDIEYFRKYGMQVEQEQQKQQDDSSNFS